MNLRKKGRISMGKISRIRMNRNLQRSLVGFKQLFRITKSPVSTTSKVNRIPYNIEWSRRSVLQSARRLRTRKSFNVFQLLVPKDKVEIVVDDTPKKMQSQEAGEVEELDIQKLSDRDKAEKTRKASDPDVIVVADEESLLNKPKEVTQSDEPEEITKQRADVVLLAETSLTEKSKVVFENKKPEISVSDEIIYLQELRVSDEAGSLISRASCSVQEKARRSQSEDLVILDEPPSNSGTRNGSPSFPLVRNSGKESLKHASNIGNRRKPFYPAKVPNFPAPVHNLLSAVPPLPTTNMPISMNLLAEGASAISRRLLRKWDAVQKGVVGGKLLRICSYNVLCQATAQKTPELYSHLTQCGRAGELTWMNRWRLLMCEFSMINADIFCLQEVQYDHYDQFYRPFFEAAGYRGEYKKRTRGMVDGCAIFYRNNFRLLRYQHIEYYLNNKSVLDRDNIAQLIRVKDIRTRKDLCIANTHLLFNKRRGDVKLAQLAVLLANIDKECGPESGQECPYILCGDFNAEPYCPLYNFIITGVICFTNLRQGEISGQGSAGGPYVSANLLPDAKNIARNCRFKNLKNRTMSLPSGNCWTHPLRFSSVYRHMDIVGGPEVSTYHSVEAANPDFIFYSVKPRNIMEASRTNPNPHVNVHEDGLRLIRRLSLPTFNELKANLGPWPNSMIPSDHIPLIADFVVQ